MNRIGAALLISLMAMPLASCGGGGSSPPAAPPTSPPTSPPVTPPSPPPPPVNQAPVFSSAAAVSVREGVLGQIYVAAASDPDGTALTYGFSGADAARFVYNATTRELKFATPPNFDAPADSAPVDNVYNVRFSASDGAITTNLDIAITVTDAPNGYRVRRVFAGPGGNSVGPRAIEAYPDGSGRITLISGDLVRLFDPATGAFATQDIANLFVAAINQRAPLNVAFSPNFLTDRKFYVLRGRNLATAPQDLEEFVVGAGGAIDSSQTRTIVHFDEQTTPGNNGGFLEFDSTGALIFGRGDTNGTAQDTTTYFGKLLRIRPQGDDFPADANRNYAIPTGNPASPAGSLAELFAFGLENPASGVIDPATGDIFFTDNARASGTPPTSIVNEINRRNSTSGLLNYGWNIRRGTQAGPAPNGGPDSAAFTSPSAELTSVTPAGQAGSSAAIVGAVYRGPSASLRGLVIFSVNGVVYTAPATSLAQGVTAAPAALTDRTLDFAPTTGALGLITAMGSDAAGNFYLANAGGDIFVLEAN